MSLGSKIKECRKKVKLSQEKVAELVGVSRQAVTKWEADLSSPNTENLFRLAEILGTSVDYLASSEENPGNSTAEQVYRLFKADQEKTTHARKARIRRNIKMAVLTAAGYLIFFLLGKVIWSDFKNMSVTGWLFGTGPRDHDYLFGWLLGNLLYLYCSLISILPALFGKYRFSFTTLAGFVIGLPLGEYLGALPQLVTPGYHYGWAIWGGIFLSSLIMGIWLQRFKEEELSFRSRKLRLWCAIFLLAVLGVIVFVLLNIPDYSAYMQ